jgi:hypothetical protein
MALDIFIILLFRASQLRGRLRFRKTILRLLRDRRWAKQRKCDPLDVVIVCSLKDLENLRFSVPAARRHLKPSVRRIIIIAPHLDKIIEFCRVSDCVYIDEADVLPITLEDVGSYTVDGVDRRGWLYQQLLKFGADAIAEGPAYIVLDADTVLASDQTLQDGARQVLNVSDEMHLPYREAYKRLLGQRPISPVSFVSHYMLLDKRVLQKLKETIEVRSGATWYETILRCVNRQEASGFSEYETYGNFLCYTYPGKVRFEYWSNVACASSPTTPLIEKATAGVKAYSFHCYLRSNVAIPAEGPIDRQEPI